jgi:hypothetical protein
MRYQKKLYLHKRNFIKYFGKLIIIHKSLFINLCKLFYINLKIRQSIPSIKKKSIQTRPWLKLTPFKFKTHTPLIYLDIVTSPIVKSRDCRLKETKNVSYFCFDKMKPNLLRFIYLLLIFLSIYIISLGVSLS